VKALCLAVRGARDFISSPAMMEALMRWGRDENIVVVRSAVQLIANIAVHGNLSCDSFVF
jgi:hypothetical protein